MYHPELVNFLSIILLFALIPICSFVASKLFKPTNGLTHKHN